MTTSTQFGYARCSTDKQDLTAQRKALVNLGVDPERIYTDHGLGPVRTKASKTARRIFLYARRGSERQDFHESVIVRLMRSIVATPTLKCRAMARMDWPSLSMV